MLWFLTWRREISSEEIMSLPLLLNRVCLGLIFTCSFFSEAWVDSAWIDSDSFIGYYEVIRSLDSSFIIWVNEFDGFYWLLVSEPPVDVIFLETWPICGRLGVLIGSLFIVSKLQFKGRISGFPSQILETLLRYLMNSFSSTNPSPF